MHPLCTITNEHTAVTYKAFSANQHLHNNVKHNYSVFKLNGVLYILYDALYGYISISSAVSKHRDTNFHSLLLLLLRFKTFLIYII